MIKENSTSLAYSQCSKPRFRKYFRSNYELYLLILPAVLYVLLFNYLPLLGNVIAFKDFSLFAGDGILDSILKSPWVGFQNFIRIFSRQDAIRAIQNTLIISIYKLIFLSALPLMLAILLNEIRSALYKKLVQTVIIFPYFLSWVIVSSLFLTFLGAYGPVNNFLGSIGVEKMYFFIDNDLFRSLLVGTEGWRDAGYGTVVYLAAITGISPELYEAVSIDGGNRYHKIRHITLPSLIPTFMMLTIMRVGRIMQAGFQQIFTMYNPAVYKSGDILGTYIYRISMGQMEYSLGAAAGLFESAIGFVLIITVNALCRKYLQKSMW